MRFLTTAFWCVAVAACLPLGAQEKTRETPTWGTHFGPEAPTAVDPGLDWDAQRGIAASHQAWGEWSQQNPSWVMLFDPRTKMPWRGYGPGIPVTRAYPTRGEVIAAAYALRDRLSLVIGVDPNDQTFVTATEAGHIWYVDFKQTVGGHRVWNCGLTLRIDDQGKLVLWGGHFVPASAVATDPAISMDEAHVKALSYLSGLGYLTSSTSLREHQRELLIHVAQTTAEITPRLAWYFVLAADAPRADWNVFVDAATGEVIEYWNDIRECATALPTAGPATPFEAAIWFATLSGVSNGTVHDGVLPSQSPVLRNINDMGISFGGTTVYTDAAGAYTFNGGAATVAVTSGLDGRYITSNNSAGAQAAFSSSGSTGTLDVIWTDTNSNIAERDGYFFATKAHNTVLLHNPAEVQVNATIVCNVNIASTCNAFYSPTAQNINFYQAGGGCINTALSNTVVEHEYGHHVTSRIYASHAFSIPGHLGEGFSDCQGAANEDSNITGAGFQGVGTYVRNLDNTCQYPTSCGTEVHARGQLIAACYWHTRVQFANAYGTAGKTLLDDYLYRHFHGSPQTEIESCMDMLVQDDNDSNLANGTPNTLKFYQGYTVQHAVPFPIALMSVAHDPMNDTLDQLQNYQIHANASSFIGNNVTSAQVFYAINAGAFISTPMANVGGTEFMGSIPVQAAPSTIRYYVRFQDSGGLVATLPSTAPTATYSFKNFRPSQGASFFADGFEAASGWVHAAVTGTDEWQNVAPGSQTQLYDPHAVYEGTKCWGTDLSSPGNGNYGNNSNTNLTSPTINCTGQSGVTLNYRRWLTVEDGLYDHARILVSNNNGASFTTVWENPATAGGTTFFIDTSWVLHSVSIASIADNQPNVKIRFELVSDTSVNRGGWTIDDLHLDGSSVPLGPTLTQLGSTAPGNPATIRVNGKLGETIFLAVDLSAQPTFYPGVGTFSLNAFSPGFILVFPGAQTIPASGFYDLPFIVPNASGVTAYFEAVLVPPATPSDPVISNVIPFLIQ